MDPTPQLDVQTPAAEVEYDFTIEDFIAFNLDFMERSFLGRLNRVLAYGATIVVWLGVPLAVVLLLLPEALNAPEPEASGLKSFLVFFAGGFLIIFPLVMYFVLPGLLHGGWLTRQWIKRMVSGGKAGNLIGRYRVRVTPTSLTEFSPAAVTEIRISSVDRLIAAKEHLFVYTSPIQAVIIPRRAFAQPDACDQFIRTIEQYTSKSAVR